MASVIRDGENGIAHTDVDQLAAGMKRLLANRDEAMRLGLRGQQTAQRRFGIERFVADWNCAFEQVLAQNMPRYTAQPRQISGGESEASLSRNAL
jgi:hypothetical protein